MKNTTFFSTLFLLCSLISWGQLPKSHTLFQQLKAKDSLLFERAFNHCETEWLEFLIGEDFEFYHDQSGITSSKEDFLKVMREGICRPDNPITSRRELITNSLEVYPMHNNGVLYAALQRGKHRFFETGPDGKERAASTALFTHLWIWEKEDWKLKRVLSFYHKKI